MRLRPRLFCSKSVERHVRNPLHIAVTPAHFRAKHSVVFYIRFLSKQDVRRSRRKSMRVYQNGQC